MTLFEASPLIEGLLKRYGAHAAEKRAAGARRA
jgi:hypothetical protein